MGSSAKKNAGSRASISTTAPSSSGSSSTEELLGALCQDGQFFVEWDRIFAVMTDFTFLETKAARVGVNVLREPDGETTKTMHTVPQLLQEDYRPALEGSPAE